MFKLKDTDTIYFDVDDTLVLWRLNPSPDEMDRIVFIKDVHGRVPVIPHHKHIEALKKHKAAGNMIVVWSQGGADWAHAVIRDLELEEFVDLVISKPTKIYDDLDPAIWMPSRIYKEPS